MTSRVTLVLKICLTTAAIIAIIVGLPHASDSKQENAVERIGPQETRDLVTSGQALLVCSYSDKRCKSILLDGALLRSELDNKIEELPMTQQIIFYCG